MTDISKLKQASFIKKVFISRVKALKQRKIYALICCFLRFLLVLVFFFLEFEISETFF